jgi:hypothetical protein
MGLALAAGAFLVPSRAQAGCDNHAFLRLSAGQVTSPHDAHNLANPLGGNRPCSGPNCSRGSDPVPLVPVFLSPSTGDQWLWVTPLRVMPDQANGGFLGDGLVVHPVRRADPIVPPPRLHPSCAL